MTLIILYQISNRVKEGKAKDWEKKEWRRSKEWPCSPNPATLRPLYPGIERRSPVRYRTHGSQIFSNICILSFKVAVIHSLSIIQESLCLSWSNGTTADFQDLANYNFCWYKYKRYETSLGFRRWLHLTTQQCLSWGHKVYLGESVNKFIHHNPVLPHLRALPPHMVHCSLLSASTET